MSLKKLVIFFALAVAFLSRFEFSLPGVLLNTSVNSNEAVELAMAEVSSGGWPAGCLVVSAQALYIDGIDEVSYWECKVVDSNGDDAGYVVVNANRTDIIIPESSPEGPTLHERYASRLGHDNFRILRYDCFTSAAVSDKGDILSSIGASADELNCSRPAYLAAVRESGVNPCNLGGNLVEYYGDNDAQESRVSFGLVPSARARTRYRDIRASLRHTFPCGWHTPQWCQFRKPNGYAIGCGPVAWAVVYAYWRTFKGKVKLFHRDDISQLCYSQNSDKGSIGECIRMINHECHTTEHKYKGYKVGYTPPRRMENGIGYARVFGYARTTAGRYRGSEFSKFDKVKAHLDADKPVILLIRASGFGIPNHYVVIEEACKRQRKKYRRWKDRDVKYLVNYCWGPGHRKWIYVREKGINQHKVYTSCSIYLVDVKA